MLSHIVEATRTPERGFLSARFVPSRYPYDHTTLRHFARQRLSSPTCIQLEKGEGGPDGLRLRPLPAFPLNFLENRLQHPLMTGNLQRPCVAYMVKFLTQRPRDMEGKPYILGSVPLSLGGAAAFVQVLLKRGILLPVLLEHVLVFGFASNRHTYPSILYNVCII